MKEFILRNEVVVANKFTYAQTQHTSCCLSALSLVSIPQNSAARAIAGCRNCFYFMFPYKWGEQEAAKKENIRKRSEKAVKKAHTAKSNW
jgi:site-specific recombinase XerD